MEPDNVRIRAERERAKAVEKYGAVALLPGGHPDYDILDYAINEVVGLARYAEMLTERAYEHEEWPQLHRDSLRLIASRMETFSRQQGGGLIYVRNNLLLAGVNLGKPETR